MRSFSLYIIVVCVVASASCNRLNRRYTEKNPSPRFGEYLAYANQLNDSGFTRESLHYLDSVYDQAQVVSTVDKYYYYTYFFNAWHKTLHRQDTALLYADSMLQLAGTDEYEYGKMLAEANYAKGDALFAMAQYEEAYHYIYTAKTLVRNNLDSCGLSDYSYRLGMVLYKQKRFKESVQNFRQAYTESNQCPDVFLYFYRRQEILDNIGLCYSKINQPDSALVFFNKGLQYVEEQEHKYNQRNSAIFETARGVIYGNMADVYVNKASIDSAEALYIKSIAINTRKLHDNIDAQYTRLKLAGLYLKNHKVNEAGIVLHDIKTISDTLHDDNVVRNWYDLMWQYHQEKQEPAIAFNYLLRHKLLTDSVNNIVRGFLETDISERFKNMDKQYEVSILQKNNQLKQNYLILMVVGAVLSSVILVLIYLNWKKSKRNVARLLELNNQINNQNKQLEKLLEDLELSNKEKDRILRVVAHDIRNPISAIVALTQFLLNEHTNYSDEQKELLELISEACSNAMTLTKDILEAASPRQAGQMEKEWVEINGLLHNSINLLRFKAEEKKQNIVLKLPEAPLSLYINKEKIWRVINNLVINAIKFSDNGSTIEVVADRDKYEVRIAVRDNGIGIPAKYKDKIFDMFTDAKRLGTAGEKSFGLGLSICKQIIEDHGGTIRFDSEENKGTTFYITLPIDSITILSHWLKWQLSNK